MLTQSGFAALPEIYDAAMNLGRWRRALDGVATALDAKAIALLIRGSDADQQDRTMLNSNYLRFQNSASGLYYGLRYSKLQNPDWTYLSRQPAHQAVCDLELSAAEILDKRPDYAYLRKKIGVRRRLGVRLNSDQVWFDAMSIAFADDKANVPDAALSGLMPLLPHLTKAVELGRTFAALKMRYKAVMSALDHVHVGLAIALPSGEIIVENRQARRIFDHKDGIQKRPNGHMALASSQDTEKLSSAIRNAAQTAAGQANAPQWFMAAPRPSGAPPFLIDVAPLNDTSQEVAAHLQAALITLIDLDHVPSSKIERFAALYNLTVAETDVCKRLAQGHTLQEIAEARDTSPVTAKNQISSIFEKTGTRRQADLIRLVLRVLPPVG